jgi:hypothetical protein
VHKSAAQKPKNTAYSGTYEYNQVAQNSSRKTKLLSPAQAWKKGR